MIENKFTDLLDSDAEAIVNTVNCVGIMGKGIALQFKKAWPQNFKAYALACKNGDVRPGKMFVFAIKNSKQPKFIINFPTKNHWKENSKIEFITSGLQDLVEVLKENKVHSVAIPPLGCGSGGLKWSDVRPLIINAFQMASDIHVYLYPPSDTARLKQFDHSSKSINMTPGRAALLALMHLYRGGGYGLGRIEIQKLAYFLQCAGEPLRLKYEKFHFGPYADNLNHALQNMDGSFIVGFGDGQHKSEIRPVPSAVEAAHAFLQSHTETYKRLLSVERLIEGFEDSFGLELLATIHWVLKQHPDLSKSVTETTRVVHEWNDRKKQMIKPWQVESALRRLTDHGWV